MRHALAPLRGIWARVADRAAQTPGLRAALRLGPDRILRIVGLSFWILALTLEPLVYRSDLLLPGNIGSDSSNYVAATERVAEGHELYELVAGDRPVPLDNPPEWSVPILSPPAIATVNIWQIPLPEVLRLYVPWAVGLAATAALGLILVVTAPPIFVILILLVSFSPGLATTAWSGNVNALIAPGAALAWWACQQDRRRWQVLAGCIVAVAACVKLGPLFLAVWLVAQRRWLAVSSFLVTGLAIAALTVVLAGPKVISDYLDVVRSAASVPTSTSIPGMIHKLGVSPAIESIALPAAMLVAVAGMFYWRRSPLSFSLAVLAMVWSTPVVRVETISVAIAAAVAWIPNSSRYRTSSGLPRRAIVAPLGLVAASFAVIAVVASVANGGAVSSQFAMINQTSQSIVVRFRGLFQSASFGYLVPANEAVYGWLDRSGSSPPVATVWSMDCKRLGLVRVPRSGAVLQFDQSGSHLTSELPASGAFADYVPDCAAELRNPANQH
jgi:hypothetical protein